MASTSRTHGIPHEDRTAAEPRDEALHPVILHEIRDVNDDVKLLKLQIKDAERGVKFLPGQWLDVFVPGLTKAGGFTLTSTPSQALPSRTSGKKHHHHHPHLELAIQCSPSNPPAAWLFRPASEILDSELNVRVGGSFTWPPQGWGWERVRSEVRTVVFVAGGVGANPLVSMVASVLEEGSAFAPPSITFLYSSKYPPQPVVAEAVKEKHKHKRKHKHAREESNILHLPTLLDLASSHPQLDLTLFLTNLASDQKLANPEALGWMHDRRIGEADLLAALGNDVEERARTLVYVCGPPAMTDELVAWFGQQEGLSEERVFCEKWW